MQKVAAEMNLPDTAFVRPKAGKDCVNGRTPQAPFVWLSMQKSSWQRFFETPIKQDYIHPRLLKQYL